MPVISAFLCLCFPGCGNDHGKVKKLADGSDFPDSIEGLMSIRKMWDEKYYSNEIQARKVESKMAQLWDALNYNSDDWFVLDSQLSGSTISFHTPKSIPSFVNGMNFYSGGNSLNGTANGEKKTLDTKQFVANLSSQDLIIEKLEIRQSRIFSNPSGSGYISNIYGAIYLQTESGDNRIKVDAQLDVHWVDQSFDFKSANINVKEYQLQESKEFEEFGSMIEKPFIPTNQGYPIGPLIVQDLDGDFFPEIALPGANKIIWNDGGKLGRIDALCKFPRPIMAAAAIVSLFDDGKIQLLASDTAGIWMWRSSQTGKFIHPPEMIWKAPQKIRGGINFTFGDFDNDGHQDIWFCQYRPPYAGGQMPTPYFDANDGEPFYLLKQTGEQKFTDVTVVSGLGANRNRRAFSGSFVDLDLDGYLDLVVTCDFSGLDLYWNNGDGTFSNAISQIEGLREGFGMSHLVTDVNQDGKPEILMTGMNVPTVDRLDSSHSIVSSNPDELTKRTSVSRGNRWLEFESREKVQELEIAGSWSKTGWSWGVAQLDFDNNGFNDFYITNGHESSKSTADYETYFWCYDIYFGDSSPNTLIDEYFRRSMPLTRGIGYSYGGYEVNRFFKGLAREGEAALIEINHALGLADQNDSRCLVAADLNLDGHDDLIYTTFEVFPKVQQQLKVIYQSRTDPNNWGGIKFHIGDLPPGTKVSASGNNRNATNSRWFLYGESYRSQSPSSMKFGLGNYEGEFEVEVIAPNGKTISKLMLEPNKYHILTNE